MGGRIMVNIIAIGRIGILGVGLGIGATLAAMPGIAAADPTPDPNIYGAVDASVLQDALPAADPSLNIAISIDGIPLLHLGTAWPPRVRGTLRSPSAMTTARNFLVTILPNLF
jgi:hypothetical protein